MHESVETQREQIEQHVYENPWKTHAAIADDLDVSRSWVTEVIGDSSKLQEVRDGYRKGVEIEVDSQTLDAVLDIEPIEELVKKRLQEGYSLGETNRIEIQLIKTED